MGREPQEPPPRTASPAHDSAPTPGGRPPGTSGSDAASDPRPDPAATAPGERLGPHLVVARLGQGGMGEVLLVRDEPLGREVAAKALRRGCDDRRQVEAFVREAQLTGRLDHPGIIPVHAFGRADDGRPYFTMKRVQGETLAAVAPAWTLVRRLEAFLKVCDAVAFAHDKGVIHRDLKPHNVMVGQFGEVVVLDWGLGRALDEEDAPPAPRPAASGDASDASAASDDDGPSPTEVVAQGTRRGAVAGTPAYMAPEQARGASDLDARTDVFGLGAILYELLTGRAPWAAPKAEASLARVLRGDLTPPGALAPGLPWELEAVLLRALARRPEDRYPGALALREDVTSFLEGRLVQAVRYGPLQRAGRWIRARRGPLLGAGAAAAALLLATGFAGRAWLDARAFEVDARDAREAAADGRHDEAVEAAERALARRADASLAALAADERASRRRVVDERARALEEAARFRRVQEATRPVARLVDEVRPLRHVAHVDLRARLVEVEAALESLERLLAEPGLDRYAEPWAVLGAGWSLCARAERARAALRRAHERAPDDGPVRVDLARLELEHALASTLSFQEAEASAPLEPPSFGQVSAAAEDARALLEHPSVRARPGSLDAARIDALAAFARRDHELMARVCTDGLARAGGELEVADLWVLLAVARGAGRAAEYRDALDRALALRPHDPWARTLRAMGRAQAGDLTGAFADLDRVLAVYPRQGLAALERGALRALSDPGSALADLDVACEEVGDLPVAWLNRGLARLKLGRAGDARLDLERAARLGAGVAAWRTLGRIGRDEGRIDDAVGATAQAFALAPGEQTLREWLDVAQRSGLAAVDSAVEAALRVRPDWPLALVTRAGQRHARGDGAGQRADLERVAGQEARTASELVVRAAALGGLGRTADAFAALDRALEVTPHDASALRLRGCMRADVGQVDGAIADLEDAATRTRLAGGDLATLAEMQLRRGLNEPALGNAQAAVQAEPGLGAAHLALGKALGVKGDFAAARPELARAVELLPRDVVARINLGATLMKLGEGRAAREVLEQACAIDETSWQAWYNLAAVCESLEDHAAARRAVQSALDAAPPARREVVLRLARQIPGTD